MAYEYKVVASPTRGTKRKEAKTAEARFAATVEDTLNQYAADGWEYLRADVLPSVGRSGLTGSATTWRTLLVFRRPTSDEDVEAPIDPPLLSAPKPDDADGEEEAVSETPAELDAEADTEAEAEAESSDDNPAEDGSDETDPEETPRS